MAIGTNRANGDNMDDFQSKYPDWFYVNRYLHIGYKIG